MHNLPALAGGTNRCTLQIHPDDAAELGLTDNASIKGPGGDLVAPVELAPGMRRGVVSLPHGWGHGRGGTRQGVAADQPGVNVNQLNDGGQLDPFGDCRTQRHSRRHRARRLDPVPAETVFQQEKYNLLAYSFGEDQVSSKITVTEKPTVRWPGSTGTAAISAPPREYGIGDGGGVAPPDSVIETTLPRPSPDSCAYCWARSLASLKALARASFTSCESSSIE